MLLLADIIMLYIISYFEMTEIEKQKIVNIRKFLKTYNKRSKTHYKYTLESDLETSQKKYDYLFKDSNSKILVQHTFSTETSGPHNTYLGDWHILNEKLLPQLLDEVNRNNLQYAISLDMKQFSLNKLDIKRYCEEFVVLLQENKNCVPKEDFLEIPISKYISEYTNSIEVKQTKGDSYNIIKGVNMSGTQNAHLDLFQLLTVVMTRKEPKSRRDIILLIDFGFDPALCKGEITRYTRDLQEYVQRSNFKEIWLVGDFEKIAYQIK
jgi:hypothetical protein